VLKQLAQLFIKPRPLIPADLWQRTLLTYPFLAALCAADQQALKLRAEEFLHTKQFHAVPPLVLTDDMAVAIAAQACLPVLKLGLQHYDFVGIVLHADEVRARREEMDDAGVVHQFDDTLSGEAMPGGPVMLSWRDVQMAGLQGAGLQDAGSQSGLSFDTPFAGETAPYNVVIHEFAHLLDMAAGEPNGTPPQPSRAAFEAWQSVMRAEYETFCAAVDGEVDTYLDPYGAENPAEFFAVACEAYFVDRAGFATQHPALATLFDGYF
jgi:MtfA peptidase